ncbi:ABC transporter substrate-binding protein [Reticulibacter mediterranei]|uniref:ABC transporter substrate-binding protein n=1 Tax=Reticulibacter mediterranei TaxID=2778369 RepID=A0A8J3IA47_9CHLR|nr:ABC transporter substrate-binding protein [Reticulibacter mediterranei]GHO90701.1 ABC transporter substrate-binding protein [Reticulibacter mediterranei]
MSRIFKTPFTLSTVVAFSLVAFIIGILASRLFGAPTLHASAANSVASNKRVDVIVKATDSQFWQAMLAGSQAAGKDWGLQVGLFGATSEADVSDQTRLVENSISRNVDAIVLAPSSSQALDGVISRARSQNIKLITVDTRATVPSDGFIGTDNVKAGAQAADRLGALLQSKGVTSGQILIESSVAGVQSLVDRDNGFQNQLKARFPGLQVTAHRYNNNDTATALSQTNDVLSANSSLVGIYADNNVSADGVAQSIRENKAQDRVVAVGFDSDPQEVAALKDGTLKAILVQNPYYFGYQGVLSAAMAAQGKYAPPSLDPGAILVDSSNMNTPAIQKLLNPPTTKGGS